MHDGDSHLIEHDRQRGRKDTDQSEIVIPDHRSGVGQGAQLAQRGVRGDVARMEHEVRLLDRPVQRARKVQVTAQMSVSHHHDVHGVTLRAGLRARVPG